MQTKMMKEQEKKANYKRIARTCQSNCEQQILQDRQSWAGIKEDHRRLIGQQEMQIEELTKENADLRERINELQKSNLALSPKKHN